MTDDTAATIERIHCNYCRQKTRHELLCKAEDVISEEYDGNIVIDIVTTSEMFRCCGCRATVLRRTRIVDNDPDTLLVHYFSPAVSRHQPPCGLVGFKRRFSGVIEEVYRSLDANNHRLPMMGARTLIDMLMVDKVGDVGTFNEKLKELEGMGVISSRNRVGSSCGTRCWQCRCTPRTCTEESRSQRSHGYRRELAARGVRAPQDGRKPQEDYTTTFE